MDIPALRNILRVNKIITVLIRYGFGGLVGELKIFPLFSPLSKLLIFRRAEKLSVPVRIRLVLESLGPTFIKLGQVASTRADLLPPEWIEELKKLQDAVPPFDFKDVKEVVEGSLRAPLLSKFSSFDEAPVASASIAQVHYATLQDSTEVAVKVKRPDIEKTIESDIALMYTLARLLQRHVPRSRRYRPVSVVDEFSRVIHNELDLTIEGANAARFRRLFKDDPLIKIPDVYWDYTTPEVLTMERVSGTPLDEVEKIKAKGLDIKKISTNGIKAFFKQVFNFGVFHADLHPGNIFTTDDGVIVYLDFGIVGRLDKGLRRYLASMLFYLMRQDYRRMALIHREMGLIGKDVDIHDFEYALRDITEPIFGKTLDTINMSVLLMRLIETARKFEMKLQPNLLLLQKSMVIIEGVGRQLYPDINMWEVIKPLIYRWMIKERFSPSNYIEKGREFTGELGGTLFDLPNQFHSLLTAALKDELKIGFVHHRLDVLSDELNHSGRRIAWGFILSAVILSSSMMAVFSPRDIPRFLGLPYPSAAGFIIAAIIAVRLVSTAGKAGRKEEK
ncbi:MAG: 2-polyprenylphenol 6-hydroxylase [Deltaproteobacteria bacterium]|nr:2-polyprenylphenol 6-hydroxylase [Deltaproteobacteria bacterium]